MHGVEPLRDERQPIAATLAVSYEVGNAGPEGSKTMSAAYDLSEPDSLPDLARGDAANDAGPGPSWAPPSGCTGSGEEACAPPVLTCIARTRPVQCTELGGNEATEASRPRCPGGEPYPGNLLADILEYRRMRARVLSGATLPDAQDRRLAELGDLLCKSERHARGRGRAYHRFDLHTVATLRSAHGHGVRTTTVSVDNISAGGVKLEGTTARAEGERVELHMNAGPGRTVVLPARVVWMRGRAVGLMFAGAARWR